MKINTKTNFNPKDLIKEIKDDVKEDIKTSGIETDIECPLCGKPINNAFVKDKMNYKCPHCEEEFVINFNFNFKF